MAKATSAAGLFKAIKKKRPAPSLPIPFPEQPKPRPPRDALDYDPTPEEDSTPFFIAEDRYIRAHGNTIWEPAVGGGHMARVMKRRGFEVIGTDIEDRGYPGTVLGSFLDYQAPLANIHITNPPYNLVNAGNGHGQWLRHALNLGTDYLALLVNWDWIAARVNGFDALLEQNPPSRAYVNCWKIDFTGAGNPASRHGWYVWDKNHVGPCIGPLRLYKDIVDLDREPALLT